MNKLLALVDFKRNPFRWVAVTIFLIGIWVWALAGSKPIGGEMTHFVISPGESRLSVARRLKEQNLIRSKPHFILMTYIGRGSLMAGTFTLDANWSTSRIVATLTSKTKSEQKITIPEGWRREQIAYFLEARGVDADQFLTLTKDLEGTLFPDTYFIATQPLAEDVVFKMITNYKQKTAGMNLTTTQLIISSIVEREAKKDEDRSLIAGIYLGRVADGMPLEADPTVQYGRDSLLLSQGIVPDPFWGSITRADYQGVVSNYNTYRISGLPPGPIANPGLKSIVATQNPVKTSARYFFHTRDGRMITSRTLEEHNRNKAQYLY